MGAHLVVSDLDGEAAAATAADIRSRGSGLPVWRWMWRMPLPARPRRRRSLPAGHRLVLVNNAGIRPKHAFDSLDRDAQWRRTMDINLDGAPTPSWPSRPCWRPAAAMW
jgi:NAD(P)-dependent dehydrogenase (short-subunit alcohol dehydrogenase family)